MLTIRRGILAAVLYLYYSGMRAFLGRGISIAFSFWCMEFGALEAGLYTLTHVCIYSG